ncbi:Embryonic flower 1, putative isoform 2 [Hibiscus syriacus]|uniref:Embryonic flower 1, putative isoform 2 n=1 Tax=Hibiscus syriacus TaxID=106335 RepID=A0A6A2XI22_HIBSY|nr:protein EMBRYONIC FLOWER 1-like [Hibiscus syriacus]XP_039051244.1 protein EMBRYONIC FLOWER 1-like [Hibiscus syriacus]KAE8658099.1 Embryonic flower 1, putative isoform 2 [Hibiscus syriacus]
MESTIVVVETQSCSSNLVPKSGESPIKIDSISIDLVNANDDIDAGQCEHFSIRGYASEMRHKNWRKCWPFALGSDLSISEEQDCKLPPLFVPKFRWWCCQNCLHEIGADGNVIEERTFANNGSKLKNFGSCPHLSSSNGGATIRLSDLQQPVKIDVVSGKSDVSARVNVNSSDKSEKAAKIANIPIIGKTDLLENDISKETHISQYDGIDVISSLMKRTFHIGNKVASLQFDKPSIKDNEIAGDTVPVSNPSCTVKDATETHKAENHASTFVQPMELVKTRGPFGVVNMVNGVSTVEYPSLELDGCDYASSESAEILLGSSSGRRKTRKVRLLTELLGKNEDEKNDLASSEDSPSTAIPDAPMGIDSVSAPHDHVSFQGNVVSNLSLSRKRKLPQDEERRLGEMSSANSGNKNLRKFNRSAETTDEIPIPDSDGTVNGSISRTGAKSHLVSLKVDKSPAAKMKNKKTQNFDEYLSVGLSREKLQKERQKKAGDTTKSGATGIVPYKSNDASKDSELDPFSESAQKTEKKSNLLKKKSKIHQNLDGHAFSIPWNNDLLREGLISRKDVEIQQTGSVYVAQDASAERGMQFSLNNFLPGKTYDGKYITPIRDGLPPLLPWQGRVHTEYEIGRKDLKMNSDGNSGFPFKSELDAYLWKRMHADLNSNRTIHRIPFLNEEQKHHSCAEVGSCSLVQQVDFSGKSNNGKSVELLDHSAIARKNYGQRAERASGQGASDYIPMEIVELMAKNQYERCLLDREIDKQTLETTNDTRSHQIRVDLNKVYGSEEMSLLREATEKPKPRAKNRRIGKIARDDMQKSVDIFSNLDQNQYNMSQLEQNFSAASFKPFPLCREKPLNGAQISAANSSRQNSAQNWQWIGNMVGQRSPPASLQALGVCNSCQSAPQQNKEAVHLWPSTIPKNMPHLFGIPQRCRDQVADVDVLSHCHRNLPKRNASGNENRNFLNQASNFEKHARKFDSEVVRAHADYPFTCKHNGMGSINLYSNETIPAMHLLSLMDAGLQSGVPVDVDGNQRFVKKTSSHGHQHSKVSSSLPSRGDRTYSMKHPTYDCYGKIHLPESFCECTSATPSASPTSFQDDKSFKKASDFTAQLSLKSREREKKKCSDSQRQNKNCRSQKNVSSSSGLNTTCGMCTVHSMPKMVLGTSDFMMFRTQLQALVSANKQKQEARTMSGTLFHPKGGSENEICSINRNPADFTAPRAGNIYMIRGEDLKFRRRTTSSGMVKFTGRKRQKKPTVREEQSCHRTS